MAEHDTTRPAHISRDDLEQKFRALQGDVRGRVDDKRSQLVTLAAGAGLLVVVVIFLLGRRSGRKKNTLVEIRRV